MESLIDVCGKQIKVRGKVVRIGRLDADKYQFLDDPEHMLEGLRKSGNRIDLFTFMQRLPESKPKYRYHMEIDNLAAIPVSTFDQWWNHQIGFKARNKAKQAEKKGVTVREVPFDEVLVKGICQIYNECPFRQGKPFGHYGKNLETVHNEEATYLDSSVFLGAFLGAEMIGFVKMVRDETSTQAGLMNIVSMIKHRDKAPTNALVAHAVRVCAEREISYLVYSNFAYGKKERDSLSDFKERNGFQKMELPRYYVPLTPVGLLALRLGMHKKFTDHLPESVLEKLRKYRNAWYNRKLQSETEAS
jgi:hypothetical protein